MTGRVVLNRTGSAPRVRLRYDHVLKTSASTKYQGRMSLAAFGVCSLGSPPNFFPLDFFSLPPGRCHGVGIKPYMKCAERSTLVSGSPGAVATAPGDGAGAEADALVATPLPPSPFSCAFDCRRRRVVFAFGSGGLLGACASFAIVATTRDRQDPPVPEASEKDRTRHARWLDCKESCLN